MKTIEELLKNLARPEVVEFGLVSSRLPSVNIGGKFEPVDDEAPGTERLMQMLVTMGGGRHIGALSEKPVQWTTRLDGVGVIVVAAILRNDVVQARFTVAKRESADPGAPQVMRRPEAGPPRSPAAPCASSSSPMAAAKPASPPAAPAATAKPVGALSSSPMIAAKPGALSSSPMAAAKPAPPPAATTPSAAKPASPPATTTPSAAKPASPLTTTLTSAVKPASPLTATPSAAKPAPPPATTTPSAAKPARPSERPAMNAIAAGSTQTARAERTVAQLAPIAEAPEPAEDDEDDDEPTIQALSPPVSSAMGMLIPRRGERHEPPRSAQALAHGAPKRIATPTTVDAIGAPPTTEAAAPSAGPADGDAPGRAPGAAAAPADGERAAGGPHAIEPPAPRAPDPAPPDQPPALDPSEGIDALLALAASARASDLHLVAGRPVLLRVATELTARTQPVSPEHVERIVREVVPARVREALDERGACVFALEHPAYGRFRVNASRQQTGYKLNLRLVPKEPPTLASLGLPGRIAEALRHDRGLVLVSAPASHGKSSTIAALVDRINAERALHVATIEEPIEHVHPRKRGLVSQRDVALHARTKACAIASALRDDADVIVIADMGDAESARLALSAVESGRLVLGALDAPGAVSAVERMVSGSAEREQATVRAMLASSLRLVIAQRLVPNAARTRVHAAVELLSWSAPLARAVREARIDEAVFDDTPGSVRLDDALAELVRAKKVGADEARRFASSPGALDRLLGGAQA